jgi:hypothetical protein
VHYALVPETDDDDGFAVKSRVSNAAILPLLLLILAGWSAFAIQNPLAWFVIAAWLLVLAWFTPVSLTLRKESLKAKYALHTRRVSNDKESRFNDK